MKKYLLILMAAVTLMSCSKHTYVANSGNNKSTHSVVLGYPAAFENKAPAKVKVAPTGGVEAPALNFLPNATAFRMSGEYANNVAVTLGPDGELIYFPAPTDITADSEPIELGQGWWLNNQGIGPNSVFTKYTFAEYAALPEVPSVEQIKLSIIPGAKVTDFIELPMTLSEANKNLDAAKEAVAK